MQVLGVGEGNVMESPHCAAQFLQLRGDQDFLADGVLSSLHVGRWLWGLLAECSVQQASVGEQCARSKSVMSLVFVGANVFRMT